VHGSSLSIRAGVHAGGGRYLWLADQAMWQFRLAAARGVWRQHGQCARGLHMATMGGIWQAVVQGFAGVRRFGEALSVNPSAERVVSSGFPLRFRGSSAALSRFVPTNWA